MNRNIIALALLTLLPFIATAQTVVTSGDVSGVWNAAGSPYLIQGEITVPLGDSLTIDPGVEVVFQGHHMLIVNGNLQAVGTETDSISFTAANTVDGWHHMEIMNCVDVSRFAYCLVEYARADGPGMELSGFGAITISYTSVNISHCTFRDNRANAVGGAIGLYWQAELNLSHSQFVGNSANSGGALGCRYHSDPVIYDCRFQNNTAEEYGGALYFETDCNAQVSRCTITDNVSNLESGGIDIWNSDPVIENCIISRNDSYYHDGSGVSVLFLSSPTIRNTIFSDNQGSSCIYFYNSPDAEIQYCDFFGNAYSNFSVNAPAGLGFLCTVNVNGDSCDASSNIFLDPQFVDPVMDDFHLMGSSPCIDAGDPDSPPDPDDTIADIGVFYYDQVGIDDPGEISLPGAFYLYPAYPNPFNPSTVFSFDLPGAGQVILAVYDVAGREVVRLIDGWRDVGHHETTFDGSNLPSGIYFYRLTAGDYIGVGKLVLMK